MTAGLPCPDTGNRDDERRPKLLDDAARWLRVCPRCDAGLLAGCTCPAGDPRAMIERLTDALVAVREAFDQSDLYAAAAVYIGAAWELRAAVDDALSGGAADAV